MPTARELGLLLGTKRANALAEVATAAGGAVRAPGLMEGIKRLLVSHPKATTAGLGLLAAGAGGLGAAAGYGAYKSLVPTGSTPLSWEHERLLDNANYNKSVSRDARMVSGGFEPSGDPFGAKTAANIAADFGRTKKGPSAGDFLLEQEMIRKGRARQDVAHGQNARPAPIASVPANGAAPLPATGTATRVGFKPSVPVANISGSAVQNMKTLQELFGKLNHPALSRPNTMLAPALGAGALGAGLGYGLNSLMRKEEPKTAMRKKAFGWQHAALLGGLGLGGLGAAGAAAGMALPALYNHFRGAGSQPQLSPYHQRILDLAQYNNSASRDAQLLRGAYAPAPSPWGANTQAGMYGMGYQHPQYMM